MLYFQGFGKREKGKRKLLEELRFKDQIFDKARVVHTLNTYTHIFFNL